MTKENKTSWEDEIKRICDSYTDEARDFNTDLEDHLISFISNLITLQRAEERELIIKELKQGDNYQCVDCSNWNCESPLTQCSECRRQS